MEIIIIKKLIGMVIMPTSLTVPGLPSPRFHVEAWLPFRNREMDYYMISMPFVRVVRVLSKWQFAQAFAARYLR